MVWTFLSWENSRQQMMRAGESTRVTITSSSMDSSIRVSFTGGLSSCSRIMAIGSTSPTTQRAEVKGIYWPSERRVTLREHRPPPLGTLIQEGPLNMLALYTTLFGKATRVKSQSPQSSFLRVEISLREYFTSTWWKKVSIKSCNLMALISAIFTNTMQNKMYKIKNLSRIKFPSPFWS